MEQMRIMKRNTKAWSLLWAFGLGSATAAIVSSPEAVAQKPGSPAVRSRPPGATAAAAATAASERAAGRRDWNQWGGSPVRNNTPEGKTIPGELEVGECDRKPGEWKRDTSRNTKWAARPGTQ